MEARRPQKAPRPGDRKPMNQELSREMIKNWNNSRMTTEACTMLSNKLDVQEMRKMIEWFRHANRDISSREHRAKRVRF